MNGSKSDTITIEGALGFAASSGSKNKKNFNISKTSKGSEMKKRRVKRGEKVNTYALEKLITKHTWDHLVVISRGKPVTQEEYTNAGQGEIGWENVNVLQPTDIAQEKIKGTIRFVLVDEKGSFMTVTKTMLEKLSMIPWADLPLVEGLPVNPMTRIGHRAGKPGVAEFVPAWDTELFSQRFAKMSAGEELWNRSRAEFREHCIPRVVPGFDHAVWEKARKCAEHHIQHFKEEKSKKDAGSVSLNGFTLKRNKKKRIKKKKKADRFEVSLTGAMKVGTTSVATNFKHGYYRSGAEERMFSQTNKEWVANLGDANSGERAQQLWEKEYSGGVPDKEKEPMVGVEAEVEVVHTSSTRDEESQEQNAMDCTVDGGQLGDLKYLSGIKHSGKLRGVRLIPAYMQVLRTYVVESRKGADVSSLPYAPNEEERKVIESYLDREASSVFCTTGESSIASMEHNAALQKGMRAMGAQFYKAGLAGMDCMDEMRLSELRDLEFRNKELEKNLEHARKEVEEKREEEYKFMRSVEEMKKEHGKALSQVKDEQEKAAKECAKMQESVEKMAKRALEFVEERDELREFKESYEKRKKSKRADKERKKENEERRKIKELERLKKKRKEIEELERRQKEKERKIAEALKKHEEEERKRVEKLQEEERKRMERSRKKLEEYKMREKLKEEEEERKRVEEEERNKDPLADFMD